MDLAIAVLGYASQATLLAVLLYRNAWKRHRTVAAIHLFNLAVNAFYILHPLNYLGYRVYHDLGNKVMCAFCIVAAYILIRRTWRKQMIAGLYVVKALFILNLYCYLDLDWQMTQNTAYYAHQRATIFCAFAIAALIYDESWERPQRRNNERKCTTEQCSAS